MLNLNFNGENFMKIGPEMTGRIFAKKRALNTKNMYMAQYCM